MYKYLYLLALILIVPTLSIAESATDEVVSRDEAGTIFLQKFTAQLKETKTAVFFSACLFKKGGKASIVFPVSKQKGLYIEVSGDNTVVNTADVSWTNGKWRTDVAQGGVYTISRVNNIIGELLRYQFQIILPSKLDYIFTLKPKKVCVEKLPE